ncbi:hypothetical protein ACIG0C_20995 [Kitasatospora aureofaciens]|uniref:Uncharacterized protein n=1 Tax=Kitasatospora aureofaciens TaxID=1894 RepID=A0A1E7N2B4_KITAU|nr:hypothetical protein [Kitasatospora aureofaciens]ARF81819.1 hypothetical protein B6264_25590 [Kitasatospora aureofaciens]OEV34822.1 hypothetical protein HS99_0010145 [Kitasatospora aureofaciens]GGU92739.1 hypothetical protein GCM10010502_52830 [Kitasatospora aureofaciens]
MAIEDTTAVMVGVRLVDEVFAALDAVSAARTPFERGLLGAYRWAVGAQVGAPVTANAAVGAYGPCRAQLLAECQAAQVHIRQGTGPAGETERALGVYMALAWLCGHHDDLP